MGRVTCTVCNVSYSDLNKHTLTKNHIDATARLWQKEDVTHINTARPRCALGLAFDGLATRCHLPAGHGGPHKGKDRKSNPYVTHRWFSGDARAFLTTRSAAWAWKDSRKGEET